MLGVRDVGVFGLQAVGVLMCGGIRKMNFAVRGVEGGLII